MSNADQPVESRNFVNPRLIDAFNLSFTQEDVDFAIPHLREDIPLYVDPFLLWCSGDPNYQRLHTALLRFFQDIQELVNSNKTAEASLLLTGCVEQREIGLGYALGSKHGSAIGSKLINDIVEAYSLVPQLYQGSVRHIEELQLVVPGVAEDRISDITVSILKDFFLDFTARRAAELQIPTRDFVIDGIYDPCRKAWRPTGNIKLPYNPLDDSPLIFAPLNLLRHLPWINYEDYYHSGYARYVLGPPLSHRKVPKQAVLEYNRRNYVAVERYVTEKEHTGNNCKPVPLFERLSVPTLRRKFSLLRELAVGGASRIARGYEDLITEILSSLLFPELKFAESRVRTISGAHIRDLIFYNDGKDRFLQDLRSRYEARQPVFELKNVQRLDTEDVNQLYRYLDEEFGRFGVLVTRSPAPKAILQNTVDLHSSKRVAIICLDDRDVELMINVSESGKSSVDVLKKKFIEFTRLLPK